MRYRFVTADVFTTEPFGGNPLAVLPDARGLDSARMQAIAREFNLSETVFVLPPDDPAHTRRLRIFTPTAELPFAGHPTIGSAIVLAALGEIALDGARTGIVFEEGAGPVPVTIDALEGRPVFARLTAPQAPEFRPSPAADVVAAVLSLTPADLDPRDNLPQAVSCGVPFLFVRLRSPEALGRARLDWAAWDRLAPESWAKGLFVFVDAGPGSEVDFQARVFVPGAGIVEDPATGAAAAAFGGWLGTAGGLPDGRHRFIIAQGLEMGRPSRLEVEVERRAGALAAVRVGGAAVLMMEGELQLSERAWVGSSAARPGYRRRGPRAGPWAGARRGSCRARSGAPSRRSPRRPEG